MTCVLLGEKGEVAQIKGKQTDSIALFERGEGEKTSCVSAHSNLIGFAEKKKKNDFGGKERIGCASWKLKGGRGGGMSEPASSLRFKWRKGKGEPVSRTHVFGGEKVMA